MNQKCFDWTQFTISFYYDVDIQTLYKKWATSDGLESFFIEKAIFKNQDSVIRKRNELIGVTDSYEWIWRHHYETSGQVLEAKENKRLANSVSIERKVCTPRRCTARQRAHSADCRAWKIKDARARVLTCMGQKIAYLDD
mgnify:CR=1 FL=1